MLPSRGGALCHRRSRVTAVVGRDWTLSFVHPILTF
jgi:hypothetical protein